MQAGVKNIADAIEILTVVGIMNSPDYWMRVVDENRVQHLDRLLINLASRINPHNHDLTNP